MKPRSRLRLSPEILARLRERREAAEKWNEFLDWTRSHAAPQWVFRGHSQRWAMKPAVGRSAMYNAEVERLMLQEFRRIALPYIDRSMLQTDWDCLAVAQHHGLPTRLLDWTTNPLVAAYFASQPSARSKRDGQIIAVKAGSVGFYDPDAGAPEPFSIDAVGFLYPPALAHRITAQRGLFSVHPLPTRPWRLMHDVARFDLPAGMKGLFRSFLYGMGIDAAFLMADLDGLCRTIAWRYDNGVPFR